MANDATNNDDRLGQRFGRYEVVAHIASGGMGEVYKAYDSKKNRTVALKVMSPTLAAKPNMIARFRREAMSAARLHHEHIVEIKEFGPANGTFFLALEFVDGKDLHDYIARSPGSRLTPEEARQITLQAAYALDHAHLAGVVHRDIKPSNFLVVQQPGVPLVKLTDFGLARHQDDDEFRVTKAGTTLGTVDYMAPEQARDSSKADIRSDLYALGCTLFHMLTGRAPFNKGSMAERILQHLESEPPDVCRLNEAVPKSLALILRKLLAKKPRDRYQTPAELIDDLEHPERVLEAREATVAERRPRKPASRPDSATETKADSGSTIRRKPKKSKAAAETAWLPWAIGAGVFALLGFVVLIVLTGRRPPADEKKPETKLPEIKIGPIVKPPPAQAIIGPLPAELKPLYQSVLPLDPAALAKEFYGPFTTFPEPPADAKIIVVSRLPLPGVASVPTLAEACAQIPAGGAGVIEIRDQGPHFLASLPTLSERSLWLRGGAGVRPLLAWVGGGAGNLLTLVKGNLTVANLDVVVHGLGQNAPRCLFHVQGGDFQARDCTFSVAGKHPHGVFATRLQGTGPHAAASLAAVQDAGSADAKARFTRCYLRGQDMVLVGTHKTSADILIDGTLAVGGAQPLIQHRNLDGDGLTVRIIRSTLIAQQTLWRWQEAAGKGGSPRLKAYAWDALLARSDAAAPEGDLLQLADGGRTKLMGFKAVNCLYAGWKNLLRAGDQVCGTLEAWRELWGHREGDLAQVESWPPRPAGTLDDTPAASWHPADTPAEYAATGGSGPLGCDIGHLPSEPPLWKQRTFERYPLAGVQWPDVEAPEISTAPDGLYHGEKIDLGKTTDLGLHVQARLQTSKPGPRVVLHLTGKGIHITSPLRFRGVEQVVIHFEQPDLKRKEKAEPLTLELKPGAAAAALIDVEGGSLEIHHGRCRFENSRIAALPPYMVRVRGGDLRLQHCTLIGPLSKAPDSFQSLIACEGAGLGAAQPASVALRDCVLLGGKPLIELKNPGARLYCRGCLLYALGDVLALDLSNLPTSRPDVAAWFEHNTVAQRGAFATLRCFEAPANCQPVVVQTKANYFLDPWVQEPRQACLLRLSAENLARGLILWQGKGNVFARDRLQGFYAAADGPVAKQTLKDWEHLVGPVGETEASLIEALPVKGYTPDQPAFDRFALPPPLRLEPAPGADLVKLGLVKKK